ncbi:MAG: pyridoxal phosphate-dependent aminotransferase family protein [Elusimicrobiota bacterium]|jgi:8-amino-7-oxononanoate synthase|nr:pyridoxal phosphate-dependent aminotransferase family protein [Elusimicrobiota bacterium]
MADILEKAYNFKEDKIVKRMGMYSYFQPISSAQDTEVALNGKKYIMAGSNNYLGLANDPEMKKAAIEAVEKFGTGSAGSRFLNGNTAAAEELEQKIAAFKGKEAGLIFSAGYQMNLGVISCLLKKGDAAIVDKLDHASILDGVKLSEGEMLRFKHNDMADLERILAKIEPGKGKLIIVDGVFSMEGDICNLPEVIKLAKKYGARLIVDDAHASGVLGKTGRGTCEHFNVAPGDVDLVVGTCSKTFASVGGFAAGDERVINYIRHFARSQIFSAAPPPAAVASISKALDLIWTDMSRKEKLWQNSARLKEGFKKLGFDIGESQTPITPVMVGTMENCFKMWRATFDAGIFTTPVIPPAVPPNKCLIRVTLMATHTDEQIDKILKVFGEAGRALGLIK